MYGITLVLDYDCKTGDNNITTCNMINILFTKM